MGLMDFIYNRVNQSALKRVERSFDPYTTVTKDQEPALLVSGAFRSGTSVTALLLSKAGYDLGPEHHLLQTTEKYKQYNPDGFLENYFFMELSRYIFHLTDSAGDNPPSKESVDKILSSELSDADFRRHAIMMLRESRVPNKDKVDVLRRASVNHVQAYISNAFGQKPLIKNPHFSVLPSFVEKYFPESKQVVVFRNPDEWLRSAKAVSANVNTDLYERYYTGYLNGSGERLIFFNYDQLLVNPKSSIEKLLETLNLQRADVNTLSKMVRIKKQESFSGVNATYSHLLKRAINA